jgi:hypothetical protein
MALTFLRRLIGKLCPHQFSWPHSGIHGRDYQVCLLCGVAYEYDWLTMRRTGRVVQEVSLHPNQEPARHNSV